MKKSGRLFAIIAFIVLFSSLFTACGSPVEGGKESAYAIYERGRKGEAAFQVRLYGMDGKEAKRVEFRVGQQPLVLDQGQNVIEIRVPAFENEYYSYLFDRVRCELSPMLRGPVFAAGEKIASAAWHQGEPALVLYDFKTGEVVAYEAARFAPRTSLADCIVSATLLDDGGIEVVYFSGKDGVQSSYTFAGAQ